MAIDAVRIVLGTLSSFFYL